jgi:Trp operon repressor
MADKYLKELHDKLFTLQNEKKEIGKKINVVNKEILKYMEQKSLQKIVDTLSAKLTKGKVIVCFPYGFHQLYMKKHKLRDFFNERFERISEEFVKCDGINIAIYKDDEGPMVDYVVITDILNSIAKCCPIHGDLDIFSFIESEKEWEDLLHKLAKKISYHDESYELVKNCGIDDEYKVPALLEFFVSKN